MKTTIKGIPAEAVWMWCVNERRWREGGRPSGPWVPIAETIAATRTDAILKYEAMVSGLLESYDRNRRRGRAFASYCTIQPCYPGRSE